MHTLFYCEKKVDCKAIVASLLISVNESFLRPVDFGLGWLGWSEGRPRSLKNLSPFIAPVGIERFLLLGRFGHKQLTQNGYSLAVNCGHACELGVKDKVLNPHFNKKCGIPESEFI